MKNSLTAFENVVKASIFVNTSVWYSTDCHWMRSWNTSSLSTARSSFTSRQPSVP